MQLNGWCNYQTTQTSNRVTKPTTEMISLRLEAMGLESTGNFQEDLKALREARNDQNPQDTQSKKGTGGPPPEILAQLQKYGLEPQGSIEADLAAIKAAKQNQDASTTSETTSNDSDLQGTQGKKSPGGPPPEIMAQLQQYGLEPQGSIEADIAAINAAKQSGQTGNSTQINKQTSTLKELQAQFMQMLGIEPTGSEETDMNAIKEALNQHRTK